MLGYVSERQRTMKSSKLLSITLWCSAKVLCLTMFGVAIFIAQKTPIQATLLGVSTVVAVPLIGGCIWYIKEHKKG